MTEKDLIEILDDCNDGLCELEQMIQLYNEHKDLSCRAKASVRIDVFITMITDRFMLTKELLGGVGSDGFLDMMKVYDGQLNALKNFWKRVK